MKKLRYCHPMYSACPDVVVGLLIFYVPVSA